MANNNPAKVLAGLNIKEILNIFEIVVALA